MAGNYTNNQEQYLLNGLDIATFGAFVESTAGFMDLPQRKPVDSFSWPDENGVEFDLNSVYFEPKTMELGVVLYGNSFGAVLKNVENLANEFKKSGLQYLKRAKAPGIALVACTEGIEVEKLTSLESALIAVRVKVKLIEPYSLTRQFAGPVTAGAAVAVTLNCTRPVYIDWGDNVKVLHNGGNITINHVYAQAGNYCLVVYGNTESITTLLVTGLTEVITTVTTSRLGNYSFNQSIAMLNGIDLSQLGAICEKTEGFLNLARQKSNDTISYAYEQGIQLPSVINLDAKEPALTLVFYSNSYSTLLANIEAFKQEFSKLGIQFLKLPYTPNIFMVAALDGVTVDMLTSLEASELAARVSVQFAEPFPMSNQYVSTVTAGGQVSLTITSSRAVSIYWGDGSVSNHTEGSQTYTHTFANAGIYNTVVVGVIDGIEATGTTAIEELEVWYDYTVLTDDMIAKESILII